MFKFISNDFFIYSLKVTDQLPLDFDEQINNLIKTHSQDSTLSGTSSTTPEEYRSQPTVIKVVNGNDIFNNVNWLYKIYSTYLKDKISYFLNKELYVANSIISSVNINSIHGINNFYEWHYDSNPVTGVLFVNDLSEDDGGNLVFKTPIGNYNIFPKKGLFIAFNGCSILHSVLPLKKNIARVSIPMNYYYGSSDQKRPDDLDKYLYGNIIKE